LVTQKFRFDLGISFIVFVNFILLVITASDNIERALNNYVALTIPKETIIITGVIFAFISTWLFGYILDRVIKYQQTLMEVHNQRNPQIVQILENTDKILKKIEEDKQNGKSQHNNPIL